MNHEFERIYSNGVLVWKCQLCRVEFSGSSPPRHHLCTTQPTPMRRNTRNSSTHPQVPDQHSPLPYVPPVLPSQPPPFQPPQSTPIPGISPEMNVFQNQMPWMMFQQQLQQQQVQQERLIKMMNDQYNFQNEKREIEMRAQQEQQRQFLHHLEKQHQIQIQKREEEMQMQKEVIDTLKMEKLSMGKRTKCPIWDKDENIKFFIERLGLWNKSENHKTKYLDFSNTLQEGGRVKEKNKIDLEIRNRSLNPESPDIINDIITKLLEWYDVPEVDSAARSWRKFKNSERKPNEDINDFIQSFETYLSELRCSID